MTPTAAFARLVEDTCESSLVSRGFKRLRRGGVVWEISDEFFGWIGLNVGKYPSVVRLSPFVGVHCVPMMRLIAEMTGEKYQLGRFATVAVSLGEIAANVPVFEFQPTINPASESMRLATAVHELGVPYIRSIANWDSLLPLLRARESLLGEYPERIAVALAITGQMLAAKNFVVEKRHEFEAQQSAYASRFNRFAIPFLRYLDSRAD